MRRLLFKGFYFISCYPCSFITSDSHVFKIEFIIETGDLINLCSGANVECYCASRRVANGSQVQLENIVICTVRHWKQLTWSPGLLTQMHPKYLNDLDNAETSHISWIIFAP